MKQPVKATALLLFVSLLSGCSSAEAKACKLAVKTESDYFLQAETLFAQFLTESGKGTIPETVNSVELFKLSNIASDKSKRVIVNNPQCFTPKQVVEAQVQLGKN